MKIGGKYNWKGQPERLKYLGRNWSGNGFWHQFEKVDEPGVVWCEVLDSDLHMLEETAIPDPLGMRQCTHPDCGRYDGPRSVECRAMADNACARP